MGNGEHARRHVELGLLFGEDGRLPRCAAAPAEPLRPGEPGPTTVVENPLPTPGSLGVSVLFGVSGGGFVALRRITPGCVLFQPGTGLGAECALLRRVCDVHLLASPSDCRDAELVLALTGRAVDRILVELGQHMFAERLVGLCRVCQ